MSIKPIKAMSRERLVAPLLIRETMDLNLHLERGVAVAAALQSLREPFFIVFLAGFFYFSIAVSGSSPDQTLQLSRSLFYRMLTNLAQAQSLYSDVSATEAYIWLPFSTELRTARDMLKELREGGAVPAFPVHRVARYFGVHW